MKTMLTVSLLAIVAMLLTVPAVAQIPNPNPGPPPGFYVYWNINLHSPTPDGGVGTAQYYIAKPTPHPSPTPREKVVTKFSVECEYLKLPDLTPLDVFVGPGRTPNEPFGQLVGKMQVKDGTAIMLTPRPPVVNKGTTVTVVHDGLAIMTGHF